MDALEKARIWFSSILLFTAMGASGSEVTPQRLEQRIAKDLRGLEVPTLRVHELQQRSAENLILVDVRSEEERQVSLIPGAITVDSLDRMHSKDRERKTVVAYCTIGLRSGQWVAQRRKKGEAVFNLHGGVLAWAQANRVFQLSHANGSRNTRKVHVYGRRWNLLPSAYQGIW